MAEEDFNPEEAGKPAQNPLAKSNDGEELNHSDSGGEADTEIDDGEVPQVAPSGQAKNFLVFGGVLIVFLVVMVTLITKHKEAPLTSGIPGEQPAPAPGNIVPAPPAEIPAPLAPAAPVVDNPLPAPSETRVETENNTDLAPPPSLPLANNAPPANETPELPPIPGSEAATAPTPLSTMDDKEKATRLKASIMIVSGVAEKGGAGGAGGANADKKKAVTLAEAAPIGDTTKMIAQGKMIDAVLESAINTDFPGVLRAIVSRDVYAESGRNVLIPKGSRLIGTYNADVKMGQARIYIIWNRVIRPDGINIDLSSPGTDLLGRTGETGHVDENFLQIFGNAILFSALSVGFTAGAQAVTGAQGTTVTTNPVGGTGTGTTTVTQSPTSQALVTEVGNFGSTVHSVVGNLINAKPTITLDQGTPIKVFVNQDLLFDQDKDKNLLDKIFK